MVSNAYLGKGIKFPLQINSGSPVLVEGSELVEQAIHRILNTPVGSTFFHREYGSRLHEVKGKPVNIVTESLLQIVIKEAIDKWEKRVQFIKVDFTPSGSVIDCFISYKILASNEVKTFVYPFYNEIEF